MLVSSKIKMYWRKKHERNL